MRRLLIIWTLAAAALWGCALTRGRETVNDYDKFYKPEPGVSPNAFRAAPATGSPQVIPIRAWSENIASSYARQGFVLIGSSGFTSGWPEPDKDAINVGIQVGADLVVILAPEYKGTETGNVAVTVPTTTTSHTSASATAYGAGGPVTAYGNSTTTTYGTSMTYVPVTVQRSAYAAGYFVKKRYRFGAYFSDLTDSERQQLQTNRGAHVVFVVDNSPAYNSDILPGDLITELDGHDVPPLLSSVSV